MSILKTPILKSSVLLVSLFLCGEMGLFAQSGIYVGGHFRRERSNTVNTLKASGFNTVILFNINVESNGDLTTDGETICSNGVYQFGNVEPYYVQDVISLKSAPTTVKRIECCIGGWGNSSYQRIRDLINAQGTGTGSILYKNFNALKQAIPAIDAINNDDESLYDVNATTSFHVMLSDLGYKTALAPYMNKNFWVQVATNINNQRGGAVDRIYIQCYDGGAGNNPTDWHINNIPLHAGMLHFNSAATIKSQMTTWKNNCGVTGGFLWVYNANDFNLADYAGTINSVFGGGELSNGVVSFYRDCNNGGISVNLPTGDYNLGQMKSFGIKDDDISSIKVTEGYKTRIYWDDNFTGSSLLATSDKSCLVSDNWNDRTTSLQVRPNGISGLNGTYSFQNRNSGMYMDVANNGDPADETNILQWPSTGGTNQQFSLTDLGDGVYKIICIKTGKSIDVAGVNRDNGANVQQYTYTGSDNQKLILVPTDNGYYKLIARHSNRLVEVSGASTTAGGNIGQWDNNGQTCGQWKLVPITTSVTSQKIEAETYSTMSGVQVEACTEGGTNVGYIDTNDWMAYNSVNFATTGTYTFEFRVSSPSGAQLSADLNAGSIQLGSVTIPATGGWQNWQTVKFSASVNAGTYNLGVFAKTGGWNFNWLQITSGLKSGSIQEETASSIDESTLTIFPVPASNELNVQLGSEAAILSVTVSNISGNILIQTQLDNNSKLDVSSLPSGVYIIKAICDKQAATKVFIKE